MKPVAYKLTITLHEATFFSSHELDKFYFTEALIGNYALAYALGLIKSPYNRTDVGYAQDLPFLNEQGIYITPAWPECRPRYRIELFNCQSESFYSAMTNNAVVEISGRQYIKPQSKFVDGKTGKKLAPPTNRPQTGILKLLSPGNLFECYLISNQEIDIPSYIRLGKFMSKAKLEYHPVRVCEKKQLRAEYKLINPIDLNPETKILFGDTINIHPVPLIRKADIQGIWWIDDKNNPVFPADMKFRGF